MNSHNSPTQSNLVRQRAKQEALNAWRGVELVAAVFGAHRAEYCLNWLLGVYGETFGLENEL